MENSPEKNFYNQQTEKSTDKAVEPNDAGIEQPAPERAQDNTVVDALENEKQKTTEALNTVRSEMGLNASEEVPPSIQSIEQQIKQHQGYSKEENEAGISMHERMALHNFAETAKSLSHELVKRHNARLNPLIDEQGIHVLRSAANNLEIAADQKQLNFDDIKIQLSKIINVINNIGRMRAQPGIRDDIQSLKIVNFKMRNIKDELNNFSKAFTGLDPKQRETARNIFQRLAMAIDERTSAIARMAEALQRYQR